jgi:2-dehydro-3-deoxyphosphogluconate aldolase / (4S)-4-hydroxy-2-oxoglutarate aldolase
MTLREGAVAEAIRRHRLIVVLRRVSPQSRLLELVDELAESGVRCFEVTFDSASAADDLAAVGDHLLRRTDGPFLIGAGTLLTPQHAAAARVAGARFGVSPILDLDLVRSQVEAGFPFIPGAMTPSEAHAAWLASATFVKLFPASAVGPQLIRELRGPFPDIQIIPTGGVDGSNAIAFLEAGAAAVGMGGAIIRAEPAERLAIVEAITAGTRG